MGRFFVGWLSVVLAGREAGLKGHGTAPISLELSRCVNLHTLRLSNLGETSIRGR